MSKKLKAIQDAMEGKGVNTVVRRLCGELIGQGAYRDVYEFKKFPDCVIKIERDMSLGAFANASEWRNYVNNCEWDFMKEWLAECSVISQNGQVLVQEKLSREGKKRKDYPTHIPAVFTDLKLANFGWDKKGNFKCCDYSFMPIFIVKEGKNLMKRAKWWGSLK